MKQCLKFRHIIQIAVWLVISSVSAVSADPHAVKSKNDVSSFPADVVTSWIDLQLKIAQTTPAPPPVTLRRCVYTGITLYESVVPGMPEYQSIASQLNGLQALPSIQKGETYYWPASANAAMASITKSLYPMTSPANKASIDSLEAALAALFQKDNKSDELARSATFGKSIADAVFSWAKTDGNDDKTPFNIPAVTGAWLPTPPSNMPASLTNWGKNRSVFIGSDEGADGQKPIPYSTDPASPYYAQVKEVYDISQSLSPEQKAIALFWADDPDGKSYGGAHWLSILNQLLIKEKSNMETAVVANAKLSIACAEATISVFKGKYLYNGLRPVTYIRTVMNKPDWKTFIITPPHPEYPSGHAVISAAAARTLTLLFGDHYKFTDNSYNRLGFAPRSFNSFEEAAIEAGNSRVYGGIHYRKTCDDGQRQGKKIAQNLHDKIKFKRS
ncbi:vanadium-dependent haloperoxidase [Dyadobacter chenwenxiniae]|uniref:Vanadium-dependent haloperoxidase n=1 Tax=Dyadobacter chenwenxiniae TaxID=2906456 RepID=A0A9X1PL23_9BACT|nr:vanadium-dependent haloperoxidase [Dyadobacter chenwenxiniae]MCF0062858.1 vanadium-dependent haloperoxidase [Dyadobacter chenwenxiniae]UON84967.1 vanadium-dependent haloperoxidase [Dyadobacter chenwenxiniae]